MKENYRSNVGMYFRSRKIELFSYQLLDHNGHAVAVVDLENKSPHDINKAAVQRVLITEKLKNRTDAIVRLAKFYHRREFNAADKRTTSKLDSQR